MAPHNIYLALYLSFHVKTGQPTMSRQSVEKALLEMHKKFSEFDQKYYVFSFMKQIKTDILFQYFIVSVEKLKLSLIFHLHSKQNTCLRFINFLFPVFQNALGMAEVGLWLTVLAS